MHITDNLILVNRVIFAFSEEPIEIEDIVHWFGSLRWWFQALIILGVVCVIALAARIVMRLSCTCGRCERCKERTRRERERERERERVRDELERERRGFFGKNWTETEAMLEIKKYERELERREKHRMRIYFDHLSSEDLHQRIDFLEARPLRKGSDRPRRSHLSDEDRRNEFEMWCEREKRRELDAIMGKDTLAHAELSHAQHQRMKQIENRWEDKKVRGPSKDWLPKRQAA